MKNVFKFSNSHLISQSKTLCLAKSKTAFAARRSLLLLTAILISFATFAQVNLNEGLVGYWSFDDGTAIDQSGNNHNGEIHGSVPFTDGDHGKYITFNGNYNNYIEVPHHDDLNFSNSFSVCTWVKILSEPSQSVVISKGRDIYSTYYLRSGGRSFTFAYDNQYSGPRSHVSASAEEFPLNEWHHVSCVADNDNQVLNYYLDGQLMAQDPITEDFNITTTYPLVFGRHFTNSNGGSAWPYPCNSSIDEVRIYNRSLNEEEVLELAGASAALGQISNVTAAQRTDGSKILDVTYDLSGSEAEYDVSLEVSFDAGENYELVSEVSGDVGMVAPGTGLQISWDAGTEFSEGFVNYTMKVMVLAEGQGSGTFTCGEDFTDARDGQSYSTVQIGDQCWMAENLNIGERIDGSENMADNGTIEKYCYDNDEANCDTYGGLYQWNEMMEYSTNEGVQGICPEEWHLPTDAEWTILTTYLGGVYVSGGKMKEAGTTHWSNPNTGATNSSGFTALPSGLRNTYGSFYNLGDDGYWWSSSEFAATYAWGRSLYYNYAPVYRVDHYKSLGFSVRCLKD